MHSKTITMSLSLFNEILLGSIPEGNKVVTPLTHNMQRMQTKKDLEAEHDTPLERRGARAGDTPHTSGSGLPVKQMRSHTSGGRADRETASCWARKLG